MTGFVLSQRSEQRLAGVHPKLVAVVRRALQMSDMDFAVLEGLRTVERQKQLVAAGASQTMRSRHLTGHAVDLAPFVDGQIRWDWPLYHRLAATMDKAAAELQTPIEWGGRWRTFKDGPHWQLPWSAYP